MSNLTYRDVLDILRLIDSGSFSDFQVEFAGTKVKVTRRAGTAPAGGEPRTACAPSAALAQERADAVAPHGGSAGGDATSGPDSSAPNIEYRNRVDVKPPMAGTFYSSPSPGAPPFVEPNREVKEGDQLGIVEVMKLFTPVLAPCDGTVRAVLVKNEEFVQSDQTLMIIEAAR